MYEVAILTCILSVAEIRRRSALPARLEMLSSATTRISRRNTKVPHRLGFRDKLGELAAAFDRLAETLREKEPPPQNEKSRFKDAAEWLAALTRFSRAVRSCPDLSSIQRELAEIVKHALPGCTVALRVSGSSAIAGSQFGGEPNAESLKRQAWHCYARIPLVARGDALGALSVYGRERPKLSSLEIDFLNLLAERAALAIEKLGLFAASVGQRAEAGAASGALVDSGRANADFISIVSHEFRTPLNLIMGYTEMMHEELMGKITAEQRTCLERVMRASDDLLALVTNMLQAGNIETGCVEITKREVCVADLLRELQGEFPMPVEKDLEFFWEVPANLPLLFTDAEKLKDVLRQLVSNALKFTERGHVMVSSRSLASAGKMEITVSDTGVGIAEHVLPVLFEKYRQLDSSIARTYEGMGLGLFIAKKLTGLLGGELKVMSRPGMGSTFTVALPLAD